MEEFKQLKNQADLLQKQVEWYQSMMQMQLNTFKQVYRQKYKQKYEAELQKEKNKYL